MTTTMKTGDHTWDMGYVAPGQYGALNTERNWQNVEDAKRGFCENLVKCR